MDTLFNENQIKGITCELQCAIKFIELGFAVSIPFGNNNRYDLLIDCGNKKYFRIQCKNAHKNKNGSYTIYTSNQQNSRSKNVIKYYDNSQIDFICSIIENNLVVIPVDEIQNAKQKIFRSKSNPPKNNSCNSTCNWIDEYTIEKQIKF